MPFNPYNALSLIAELFPEDPLSQSQGQDESSEKPSSDTHRRGEITALVNHIAKGFVGLSPEQKAYCLRCEIKVTVVHMTLQSILR